MELLVYLFVSVIVILQIADFYTTHQSLKFAGNAEANPVVDWFMSVFGQTAGLIIVKFYVVVFVCYGVYAHIFESRVWMCALFLLTMLYVVVVSNNLRILKASRKSL